MTWYRGLNGGKKGEFVLQNGQCSTTSAYKTETFLRELVDGKQYIISYRFASTPTTASSRTQNGGGFRYNGGTQTVKFGEATFTIKATTISCTYTGSWSNMWVNVFEVGEDIPLEEYYL